MFVVPLELCVKCYALVFKSELLSPSHIPYHITVVITNLKKKNLLRIKTSAVSLLSLTLSLSLKKWLRLSLRLTLSLKNCFSAESGVFPRQY